MSTVTASEENRPVLRVVSGDPGPEELAVLTALFAAGGGEPDDAGGDTSRRGGWNDPARQHRAQLFPGVNGWRSSLR